MASPRDLQPEQPLTPERSRQMQDDLKQLQQERQSVALWSQYRLRLPSFMGPPKGFRLLRSGGDGAMYRTVAGGHLAVIESVARESDGRVWHHVSVSRRDRDPTWRELIEVKEAFIGSDREAYIVAPPRERYVNLVDHVLHWWYCLDAVPDGAVLPAFAGLALRSGALSI